MKGENILYLSMKKMWVFNEAMRNEQITIESNGGGQSVRSLIHERRRISMNSNFNKTALYPWALALALAGLIALPLSGNGGLMGQPGPEVEDEVDWALAKEETEEEEVDWTLAKEKTEEEEVDWTLA